MFYYIFYSILILSCFMSLLYISLISLFSRAPQSPTIALVFRSLICFVFCPFVFTSLPLLTSSFGLEI